MRRTIVLALVALLSVTGIATAQTAFPPELNGDGAVQGGTDLEFVQTEYFNPPWSIPDPDPKYAWLTDIFVQILPPYDIVVEQECLLYNGECWLPPVYPIAVYPWRHDIGSYCDTQVFSNGDMTVDCYVFDGTSSDWAHYIGALEFTGHAPQFYEWDWYLLDVALSPQGKSHIDQPAESVTE